MSRKRTVIKNQFLWKRISENYPSLLEFYETSGVPLGWEVVRRAVYEGEKVSAPSIILLMKYAGFSASEIKAYLKKQGDKEFSELIGECNAPALQLQEWERELLKTIGAIRKKSPTAMAQITALIETTAKAEGVEFIKARQKRK